MSDTNLNGTPCEVCGQTTIHVVGSPMCLNRMGFDGLLGADDLITPMLRALASARADAARSKAELGIERLNRKEEAIALRAERDHYRGASELLVGAEEMRQALEAKLREACGGSEPSEGHDYADEVIGLLRVARSQRDTAEATSAALRSEAARLMEDLEETRRIATRLLCLWDGTLHGNDFWRERAAALNEAEAALPSYPRPTTNAAKEE